MLRVSPRGGRASTTASSKGVVPEACRPPRVCAVMQTASCLDSGIKVQPEQQNPLGLWPHVPRVAMAPSRSGYEVGRESLVGYGSGSVLGPIPGGSWVDVLAPIPGVDLGPTLGGSKVAPRCAAPKFEPSDPRSAPPPCWARTPPGADSPGRPTEPSSKPGTSPNAASGPRLTPPKTTASLPKTSPTDAIESASTAEVSPDTARKKSRIAARTTRARFEECRAARRQRLEPSLAARTAQVMRGRCCSPKAPVLSCAPAVAPAKRGVPAARGGTHPTCE